MKKKFKKNKIVSFLLILSLFLAGCTSEEFNGNIWKDFEKTIDQIVERGNEIIEDVSNYVEKAWENLEDMINGTEPDDVQTSEGNSGNVETLQENPVKNDYLDQYKSRAIEDAFGEIPKNYEFTFDVDAEAYLLKRLNDYREENGLEPLELRADLTQSAKYKSLAMLQYDYFSHDNPNLNGKTFDYLMWEVLKLSYTSIGENLAFVGNSSPLNKIEAEELFLGWKNSPAHNEQMLNPYQKYIGIGVVRAKYSGPYFKGYQVLIGTQHFGG
ncbi:MAG: CAP domain-containing protein [Clostridiaceae bacterium]